MRAGPKVGSPHHSGNRRGRQEQKRRAAQGVHAAVSAIGQERRKQDPALLVHGHILAADMGLWDLEAELMARRTAVDRRPMGMVACNAVQIVPMGTVGIVRELLGSVGDLR